MKTALALSILALFAPPPADAQQTRAQVPASATIVEAVGVTVGATTVTPEAGGALDVTTPLSIRGAAPRGWWTGSVRVQSPNRFVRRAPRVPRRKAPRARSARVSPSARTPAQLSLST